MRVVDVYAGAGGLSCGFVQEGFTSIWANEMNEAAAETYAANFGDHVAVCRLEEALAEGLVPEADVVVGGPPCQGFSAMNQNRKGDPRRQLWRPYLETVEAAQARVFVMENVPPLLKSQEYLDFLAGARELGFTVGSMVLCAADYGVPQVRNRAIVVGVKGGLLMGHIPPPPTHRGKWVTLRDAFADLDSAEGLYDVRDEPPPLDLHFQAAPLSDLDHERLPLLEEGQSWHALPEHLWNDGWSNIVGGFAEVYGRLWWDRPSPTLRTKFHNPTTGRVLHPTEDRCLTLREGARIQGFPDDFIFKGNPRKVVVQIGNAVPPPLGAALARAVRPLLS